MKVDITKLIKLSTAARILNQQREWLQFYNATGRFVKKYIIDGTPYYHIDDVKEWKPKSMPQIKMERKKK